MGRPLSQAVHDRAELLARSHPLQTVAMILGLHPSQITRMKKRGWKAALHAKKLRRPVPGDFQLQAADMSWSQLIAHYRCGDDVLARWFRETPNARASWRGDSLRALPRQGQPRRKATGGAHGWDKRRERHSSPGGGLLPSRQGKAPEELAELRKRQWETRRARYGASGQRSGAQARPQTGENDATGHIGEPLRGGRRGERGICTGVLAGQPAAR